MDFASRLLCLVLLAAPAAPYGVAAEPMGERDIVLARQMAGADLVMVSTGKVALTRARSGTVRKYAQLMVDTHGKLLAEAETLAKRKAVDLPGALDDRRRAAAGRVAATPVEEFDRAYIAFVVAEHREAVRLAKQVAAEARDPNLKALAAKAMPHVRKHLEIAEELAAAVL